MLESQSISHLNVTNSQRLDPLKEDLPRNYRKKRFYTLQDIEPHSFANDLWVVLFGNVLDLTELVQFYISSSLCQPIIDFAGKDVTHWFSSKTKEPKTRVDPETGRQIFYCPNGRLSDVNNQVPPHSFDSSRNRH